MGGCGDGVCVGGRSAGSLDELIVLVPFGKNADEARLSVENVIDVCWCNRSVEPCCGNGCGDGGGPRG